MRSRYDFTDGERGKYAARYAQNEQTNGSPTIPRLKSPHRDAILLAAARFFGRPVDIDERVFQSLEVVSSRGTTPTPVHVWGALAEVFPGISSVYARLNIGPDRLAAVKPRGTQRLDPALHDVNTLDFDRLIRSLFSITNWPTRETTFTSAANDVVQSGKMTLRELVLGIIDSARITSFDGKVTNLVIRNMGRGAGFPFSRRWTSGVDAFRDEAVRAFEEIAWSDPSFGQQQFVLYHDGRQIRVRPFGVDGTYLLQQSPLPDGSLWIARGNMIQPPARFSEQATDELEYLINQHAPEREFQGFFEAHPEFLLSLGNYGSIKPQIVLHEDDGGTLIPDFFLEKLNSDLGDICDLKLPTAELVRHQRHRQRFRSAVMEAVAQLSLYRDWFEEKRHRDLFASTYGLHAYRPRAVLVIGRRSSFSDDIERIRLESDLPPWVSLTTYDDVVARSRQLRQLIIS